MLEEATVIHSPPAGTSATHLVHTVIQFLMAVRHHKSVMLTAAGVTLVLGGLYFATATRYYGSKAQLLVIRAGMDSTELSTIEGNRQQGPAMPTFENLATCAAVIEGALERIPPDCIDMAGAATAEQRVAVLRRYLSATTVRSTNIIEISYCSKDPDVAAAVVRAVIDSYMSFLNTTHEGTKNEIIRVLQEEKDRLVRDLNQNVWTLYWLRRQYGDLVIAPESNTPHPVIRTAISFNESLIETQKQRVDLEASLAAIRAAIRSGEDLQPHVMSVANVVGREIMLRSLGIEERESYTQAVIEKQLLEDRAALKAMQDHLGPAHPEVVNKVERIRAGEQYLLDYQQRIGRQIAEIQGTQLGPMLLQMVQEKLKETWQREASLQAKYQEAVAAAVSLNDRMAWLEILQHDLAWRQKLRDALVEKISSFELKQNGQEIRTKIIQEPIANPTPVSPRFLRVLLMSLFAGLAMGLAVVYVLDTLDDRFRSAEELQGQLKVPVLSMVRQLKLGEASGLEALQMYVSPHATESEAFRTLRTALALASQPPRHIVISSAEPGDGKTTILANLAVSYAQSGKRTLLIDADLRRPGLTALMELRGVEGLSSVLRGDQPVGAMAAACIRPSGIEGLDVLASGPRPSNPAELLAHARLSELLAWTEGLYDQVLIDSPPALATSDAAVIGRLIDGVILAVQPDKNRRRMVLRAVDSFTSLKIPLLGIVINRVGSNRDPGYYGYGYGYAYGYGYSSEYGPDEEEEQAEAGAAGGKCLPAGRFGVRGDQGDNPDFRVNENRTVAVDAGTNFQSTELQTDLDQQTEPLPVIVHRRTG